MGLLFTPPKTPQVAGGFEYKIMPRGIYKRIIGVNCGLNKGKHWKLSDETKNKLDAFKEKLGTRSYDEAIQELFILLESYYREK